MLGGHLMDSTVSSLNGELHQVFHIFASADPVRESLVQNVNRFLRSDFARIGAPDTVGNHENATFSVGQKRIFVQGPLLAQATITDRCNLNFFCGYRRAHWTASRAIPSSDSRRVRPTALASWALRCEKAINMPSMAKLVIKLNPP